MNTECTAVQLEFPGVGRRRLVARFDGGAISSDAGALLLKEVEARTGLLAGAARCFVDHRDPERIEHSVEELVSQRVVGLALGYEDLNDHDELRHDALLAAVVGKEDPTGSTRVHQRDRGKALAGKSTLNRLELTPDDASGSSRYQKIVADESGLDALFVEQFVSAHERAPGSIVLDVDATDDPLHGHQEGRFFHGYYRSYCYLPLYIFCGEHLLCARLRPSNIDGAAGTVEELERIVAQIRCSWPQVQIIVRGDSGFCREELMDWCEANEVDYVLGLAKNTRLIKAIAGELEQAREFHESTAEPARVFRDFIYATRKSWSRSRRVVGKAEHLSKGANPRFIVTTLPAQDHPAKALYEELYCARGHGEPYQGTTTGVIRRPNLDGNDASQPAAVVLLIAGLLCAPGAAPARAQRHVTGTRSVRHHTAQAAQARRARACHGTQYLGLVLPELSVRRAVYPYLP